MSDRTNDRLDLSGRSNYKHEYIEALACAYEQIDRMGDIMQGLCDAVTFDEVVNAVDIIKDYRAAELKESPDAE